MRVLSECSLLRIARLCHSERNEESLPLRSRKGTYPSPLMSKGELKGV